MINKQLNFTTLNIYAKKLRWKFLLFISAVIIGLSSLWYTSKLVKKLADEERKKVELWAEAQLQIINADLSDQNLDFYVKVLAQSLFSRAVAFIAVFFIRLSYTPALRACGNGCKCHGPHSSHLFYPSLSSALIAGIEF